MKVSAANLKIDALVPVILLTLWREVGLVLGGLIGLLVQNPQRALVRFLTRTYMLFFFPVFCVRLARLLFNLDCNEIEIENDWIHFYYLGERFHCRLSGLKILVPWKNQTYVCTLDCYPIIINATATTVLQEIKIQSRQ